MTKEVKNKAPGWATRFLHWFCKEELIEEIEGDINEEYYDRIRNKSKWKADLVYIFTVISFFRPFAIRKINIKTQNNFIMFSNYFKVALRVLSKDKINSFITAAGLFVAIASAAVIYLVVRYETGYDTFHTKADRIYRMVLEISSDDTRRHSATVGPPVAPALKEFYPEVENAVRFRYTPTRIVATENQNKRFYEDRIFFVDPSIFDIFTYPLLSGDPGTALKGDSRIVISSGMAEKYFGKEDPIGKTLLLDNEIPFTVSGVLAPVPSNTHFKFDFLIPFEAFEVPYGYPVTLDDWSWGSFHTYILLKQGENGRELEKKLNKFAETHFSEDQLSRLSYGLQSLKDIYFGNISHEDTESGNRSYVVILTSIGILLLLLAAFNFTNISTAKSISRSTETGLRKTLGSSKTALLYRYLSEPIMVALSVVVLVLVLLPYLLREVRSFFNIPITWESGYWLEIAPIFVIIGLLIGIFSGFYPAFIMSSYKPLGMVHGHFSRSRGGLNLRNTLVTLQFAITSFLLIGSFIISSQIRYLEKRDLGFEKDELILLRIPGEDLSEKYPRIRNTLLMNPRVKNVSVGGGRLDGDTGNVPILPEGFNEPVNMPIEAVREDYYKTIGTDIISGREFSAINPSDSIDGIIINRAAAEYFEWSPEEALGKTMSVGQIMRGRVIGVVENYHTASLHNPINPLIIYYPRTLLQDIYVRVEPGEIQPLISSLKMDWESVAPDIPFDFEFLNHHLQNLYNSDIQFSKMVRIFALITIILSILGLYGLVSLTSEQKVKEISIRKVLGASFISLIYTLSRSYIYLIFIANIIAWPVVYLVAGNWLSEFAYHTDIHFAWFIIALFITVIIAASTLLYRTGKVARLNPALTLKYE